MSVRRQRGSRALLLLALLAGTLATAEPAAADVDVYIHSDGIDPAHITVRAGEPIHWTNDYLLAESVTSATGLFDSGLIPTGGGFTMALHVPGVHAYGSSANPAFQGTIRVIATELAGGDDDLVDDRIPDLLFPPPGPDDIGTHPMFGVEASPTRILLGFTPDATVGAVNEALDTVDAEIIGGRPDLGMLLIEVPEWPYWSDCGEGEEGGGDDEEECEVEIHDLGRFTGLDAALQVLRGSPAVDFAAMSTAITTTAIPRRSETTAEGMTGTWSWDSGGRANWGLKDARFPQAWNLVESITRERPSVVTGIIDSGFEEHEDLPGLDILTELCTPAGECSSIATGGRDHGNHVAGTIGAGWDNPATPEPPRSARQTGISGGNPFAKMTAASWRDTLSESETGSGGTTLFPGLVQRFAQFLAARPSNLRVVNYSGHAAVFDADTWWQAFPTPDCGPGETDDPLPEIVPGTKDWCTPNNQDDWLREMAQLGQAARRVAELYAQANVMIVQAAGNDSDDFCPPLGVGCTGEILRAETSAEYAWASNHWTSGAPNPIFVVQAIGSDDTRSAFSNVGGDIAAPGQAIGSTVLNDGYESTDWNGTSMAAPHVTAAIGYLLADEPGLGIAEVRSRLLTWGRQPTAGGGAELFTWRIPDRLGLDADANRLVDYHTTAASVGHVKFPVDFDACGARVAASGDPVDRYTWTLNGETIVTAKCTLRYEFAEEGSYAVTLVVTGPDGTSSGATRTVTVDDLLVVSIGDSIASGEGVPDIAGGGLLWQSARCDRSAKAGPAQAARWLELADVMTSVTFAHLACSGGRMRGDLDANGDLVPGDDGEGGLLTPYSGINPEQPPLPPQLDELASLVAARNVDALLISIGANDMRFSHILMDCLIPFYDCGAVGSAGRTIFDQRIAELPAKYDELDARLDALGISPERVFITEYMDATRDEDGDIDLSCGIAVGVEEAEDEWAANTIMPALNGAVSDAAARHGWNYVGGIADDFREHGYCSDDSWIVPVTGSLFSQFDQNGGFHPNTEGHKAYATRIVESVREKLGLETVEPVRVLRDTAPRLDVFAALTKGGGSFERLADVNDVSDDGSRRVIRELADDGQVIETPDEKFSQIDGEKTAPDGFVDMRDFRRFRDAWLSDCAYSSFEDLCPDAGEILLDGDDDHPKKDFNLDGCVHRSGDPDGCGAEEDDYSRFDFNGDTFLSVEFDALVALQENGQPAETPGQATRMTDLDVFRSQWSPAPGGAEGWEATDLDTLLRSADIEVHADEVFDEGATRAQIQARYKDGEDIGPPRTLKRSDDFVLVTVPFDGPASELEVVAEAETDDGTMQTKSEAFTVEYGEDKRVDLCPGVSLKATPRRLPADGESRSVIRLKLHPCGEDTDVSGKEITWTVEPGTGGGQLDITPSNTDANGKATARLVAGDDETTYTVKAVVDLGEGETKEGEVEIEVVPLVTIRYLWRQTIEAWNEQGSTRWGLFPDPLMPDCVTSGVEYCIDDLSIQLETQTGAGLERTGTLTGGGSDFTVTEQVLNSTASSIASWTLSKPDEIEDGASRATWSVNDPSAYQDHEVDGVRTEVEDNGIRLSGLQSVGDLPYHYSLVGGLTDGTTNPIELHDARNEFLLIPQGGDRLRFGAHRDRDIVFRQTETAFEQFSSCDVLDKDLTTAPGYLVLGPSDYIGGAATLGRKTQFVPGDRPMPVGPGHLTVRYSFAATVAYAGTTPADPVLPDCSVSQPPDADFVVEPAAPKEGRQTVFRDTSTDGENDIVRWEWETSEGKHANGPVTYGTFDDSGTVTVKLTVTDAKGGSDSVEKQIQVGNLPPEGEIEDARAQVGTPLTFSYRTLDPGHVDKQELEVKITSPNPIWPTIDRTEAAAVSSQSISGLPAGSYPVTLTVTDKDGASVQDSAVLIVTPEPPEGGGGGGGGGNDDRTFPTCHAVIELDSEEQEFVDLVNEYRAENGLPPVEVSGTLMEAALRHARDMAINDFMAHEGSDGSEPADRAYAAGYPTTAGVGENLMSGSALADDALWAWRSSTTGHNENMLNPNWKAIGLAREQGSMWRWASSYGTALDCPVEEDPAPAPSAGTAKPPTTMASPPRGGVETIERAPLAADVVVDRSSAGPAPPASQGREAAPTAAAADLLYPPTVAFTISDVQPRQGRPVTFGNRSRDADGTPIAATITPEWAIEYELGPDETVTHPYISAFSQQPTASATDAAGRTASVERWIWVEQKPSLSLQYMGPTLGVSGKTLAVSAIARDPLAWPQPVSGAELTFELGTATATATTGADGVAEATLDLTGFAPGFPRLTVSFAGNDDFEASQTFTFISVITNTPPVARAGGPYVLGEGGALLLDGSRSTDPDDQVAKWEWDLDGDGDFDDATGRTPAEISWNDLQGTLCGGVCSANFDYPVELRVTDTRTDTDTDTTTVTFTADFGILLGGETKTVVPGAANHFAVTVVGSTGWTHPVTLTIDGLPDGVTATFSKNPVTPPDVSILTITAQQGAATGTFPIVVTGSANGITHSTGDDVVVAFGLIPICYGSYTGVVTNRDTGAPVPFASVRAGNYQAPTDENGRYVLPKADLGNNNAPTTWGVAVNHNSFWPLTKFAQASCGAVTRVDFAILAKGTGRLDGQVLDKETREPIAGALVYYPFFGSNQPNFFTDSEGRFGGNLQLGFDNSPTSYFYRAQAPNYWYQDKTIPISAETPAQAEYELVRQCRGTIAGGVVYAWGTTTPVPNAAVQVQVGFARYNALSNAEGEFSFNRQELLGHDNTPIVYFVQPFPPSDSPPGSQGFGDYFRLNRCGDVAEVVLYIKVPVSNFGTLEGVVRDEVTNEPVPGASVTGPPRTYGSGQQFATTDANGAYRFEQVFVGFDSQTGGFQSVGVAKSGYYGNSKSVFVPKDGVATADLTMLRKLFATAEGTVTDLVTGAPIPIATVSNGCFFGAVCVSTDREGRYRRENIELGFRNAPISTTLTASATGYWQQSKPATFRPGETTTTNFQLLKECPAARVIGTVVNANTQEPIPGAMLQGGGRTAFTNAAGRFELTDLRAGANNSPTSVFITASASGFFSQSKQVTIFCGATIVIDFGTRTTALSTIVGTVTNLDTGQPMANVFIGSEFGGTATTDGSGNYRITEVPLGDLNADKAWKVTALPTGFKQQTQTVIAKANEEVRADFGFSIAGNRKPVGNAQDLELNEDGFVQLTLTGSDADDDPLTFHVMRFPAHGRLTGNAPALTYQPDRDYTGPDSFEFIVNDGQDNSERATVTFDVKPINDSPAAFNDSFTRPAGAPARIPLADILANDIDVDGDALAVTQVFPWNSFVTATIDGDDLVVTAPAGTTQANVNYLVADGHGGFSSATIFIQFVTTPIAPVCADATFNGVVDEPIAGQLTCTDGNGDALTYSLVAGPDTGELSLQPDGSFTYAPPDGFVGTKTFTFKSSDGGLDSQVATATLVIGAANEAPVATDSSVTVPEDGSVPTPLAATDDDGDPLTFEVVSPPEHGTLSGTAPALAYTPAANYHGPDSFTFKAADGTDESNVATVSITVTPVNDAPVATDAAVTTAEDTAVELAFAGTDVDGDTTTAEVLEGPAHGTLDGATYTPAANYHGPDSVRFRVSDGSDSDEGLVSITVTPVTDAPVADDASVTTPEDTAVTLPMTGSDVDGDSLAVTVLDGPSHGALVGNTYTPAANYYGPDSVRFRVSDGSDSDEAVVSITVTPVNDPPLATDAAVTTPEDTPTALTFAGVDVEGDSLTSEVLEGPAHGTLSAGIYTPAANYFGPDSVRFRVTDGSDADEGVVSITVSPVNDLPVCLARSAETRQDTAVDVAPSCTDVEDTSFSYQIVAQGSKGVASIVGGQLHYLPNAGATGADSFRYRGIDSGGGFGEAPVAITITPVQQPNDPPLCANASFSTLAGVALTSRVSCTDADGDALAYRLVSGPSTGSLVFRPDGTFTYTPASGFTGTTSFRFKAEDGQGGAGEALASIAVTPAPDVTPPSCGFSTQGTNSLGQKLIRVSVRDQGSGLASITVLQSVNVTIAMPTFAVGKRTTLLIWATQIDKTKPTIVEFAVADLAGNITTCDPVFTTLRITRTVRGTVKPHAQTFLGLPQNESKLVVRNKRPGLKRLDVIVNGRRHTLTLRPGQTRRLDFHKAMRPGRVNTVTIRGHGRPGARADITIADRWV